MEGEKESARRFWLMVMGKTVTELMKWPTRGMAKKERNGEGGRIT
jgi:hypothetical protein